MGSERYGHESNEDLGRLEGMDVAGIGFQNWGRWS